MNVEYFTRPLETVARAIEPGLRGANYALAWFEYVFMHGKFWTMFAMLFGMGFAVMLDRVERAGRAFLVQYLRRTGVLLAIGLAHAILVWSGDILHSYAIAACMLLLILHGFGLFGHASYGVSLLIAIAVFVLLAWLGRLWLQRFPQGPMEALWRRLSYSEPRMEAVADV